MNATYASVPAIPLPPMRPYGARGFTTSEWNYLDVDIVGLLRREVEGSNEHYYTPEGAPMATVEAVSGAITRASDTHGKTKDRAAARQSADPYEVWTTGAADGRCRYGSEHHVGTLVDGFRVLPNGDTVQRVEWSQVVLLTRKASDIQREQASKAAASKRRKYASNADRQRAYRERVKAQQAEREAARKASPVGATVEWQ